MARDRSIKLVIQAEVNGAKRALHETAEAARKVGAEAEGATKKATTAGGRLVQSARENGQAWTTAGATIAGAGAVMVGGFTAATAAHIGFEKSMSGVKAVANASQSEMDALTESALEMGAATAFSASEAAVAQGELARAGVSTADILGGALKGSMDLAAAGGLDLADAAVISAQAMNLFNLEGKDVSHIADVLASGANKSAADVSDLGMALSQAGTVASQTGLSLEETVGALSMFADAGIRGSDAGTSLKSMLQRLTPQSKEARDVMADLGFSAFDAQGNFIGLEALAGELQDSFGGLDTESRQAALGVAFGSDAIRAASVLMAGGTEAAAEYTEAMNDQGAAARMAATMMDNLAGDWEEFTGAIETALIRGGTASNDFLRGTVTAATEVVNVYNDLPAGIQGGVTALAGIAGVAALGAGGLMILVPKAVETVDAFRKLAEISPRTASGLGKVAGVVGKGGLLVGGLVALATAIEHVDQASWDATPGVETFRAALLDLEGTGSVDSLDQLIESMDIVVRGSNQFGRADQIDSVKSAVDRLLDPDLMQRLENFDKALGLETSGTRATEALAQVDSVLAGMTTSVEGAERAARLFDSALGDSGYTTEQLMTLFPQYADALAGVDNAAREAAAGAAELTPEMEEQERVSREAAEALAEYEAELAGASAAFVDSAGAYSVATTAAQEWAQGVADSTESSKDSWDDYVADFTGTKDEYLAELERMAEAQTMWEENLLGLIARGVPAQFVQQLAEMGPAAADEVALIATMTDEELTQWVGLMEKRGGEGGAAFATNITNPDSLAVLTAAGEQLGEEALAGLVAALAAGEVSPQEAIDQWDLDVEIGGNTDPLLEDAEAAVAEVGEKTATPKVDADTSPAEEKAQEWVYDTNLQRPVPKVDADTSAADEKARVWRDYAQSQRPQPKIDADAALADAVAQSWRSRTAMMTPTPKVYADPVPADAVSQAWARRTALLVPRPNISAYDEPARRVARGLVGWMNGLVATITVGTRYAGGLNVGGANRLAHSAVYTGGIKQRAAGGFVEGYAPHVAGPAYGVTDLYRMGLDGPTHYAESGRGLTKEAYISDHPAYAADNVRYLREAAGWFGMDVVKAYAAGGTQGGSVAHYQHAPAPDFSALSAAADKILAAAASIPEAMSEWQPMVHIDGREFRGVMRQAQADGRRHGG